MNEIAALIEPFIPALRRYAWALVRNDEAADDLVQDCLEKAVNRWHLRRHDGNLRAWLFTIQRNLFINGLRQRNRRGTHVTLEAARDLPSAGPGPDHQFLMRDTLTAIATLPEQQISILLLVGVEGLSYNEVAQVLQLPVGTIMSRLSRAREKVRQLMETGKGVTLRSVK